ncbi:group 1 glycosyl transferase [Phenylobacterium hankyongense]|uniref:Group 1 glycosyl transferase n=1 Tax=Phenylobacterium hankyongense TaxID=1813876 RepID=A0A328B3J2_9CAUL|nr:glycosyltransferase [Phenylobacterium hankyongense]RAK61115.1 group 1 glycosyl transferase [Phenylobacterium hankyongense]
MRGVLFVHNNFPAQFRDLAQTLVALGVPCAAVAGQTAAGLEGVRIARYNLPRGTGADVYNLAIRAEADLLRGRAALKAASALKAEGFEPEVIIGHPGWGETVLLDDIYPDARQVLFSEFFYHGRNSDIDFDTEFLPASEDALLIGKAKNAVMALALTDADAIVTPTPFQASRLPPVFRRDARIIHEGIDVEAIRPGPAEPFPLADGRIIAPGTPVITHINNQLEALRGLHIFARALPRLLAEVPEAQVLVIGQEGRRGYGGDAPGGQTWRQACFAGLEARIDPARVHFLGKVPHARMLAALRLSTAHVYYTYPFVLSWSLAEAMASGCYVIGSDTAPLRDAIEDGVNGRLLPFFDVDALSQAMIAACHDPQASAAMRVAARRTAEERFSRAAGRAAWLDLLREVGLTLPA